MRNYINKVVQAYYDHPTASYLPLTNETIEIKNRIRNLIVSEYPNYTYNTQNDDDLGSYQDFINKAKKIKDILSHIPDSKKSKSTVSLISELDNYDWVSFIDNSSINNLDKMIKNDALLYNTDSTGDEKVIFYGTRDILSRIDVMSKLLNDNIDSIINHTANNTTIYTVSVTSSYYLDIIKNAKTNVTFDIGGGYSSSMDQMFGYYAINVYFRSIDKNLPARNTNYKGWDFIGSRFSLLAGITLTPVDKSGIRKGIVGNKGIVGGGSFRLLPWLKINGGSLMYYGKNTNPLITSYTTRFTPFLSMSIDIDIKPLFSSVPLFSNLLAQ